jgi:hypothetical protein
MTQLKDEFNIHPELTSLHDDYSQYNILCKYWGKDDLITIDRSIVMTNQLLRELIDCPESNCTHYYKASKSYSPDHDVYAIGAWIKEPTFSLCFGVGSTLPKYCTFSGTGFTKIARKFQTKPLDPFSIMIKTLDGKPVRSERDDAINQDNAIISNINSWLDGFVKFHIHREVEHQRSEMDKS